MPNVDHASLSYNQIQQKSSHNSFERDEGIVDQITKWYIRSLEFDLHIRKKVLKEGATTRDWYTVDGDWFIYHDDIDYTTSYDTLSRLLNMLASLQKQIPDHEVMTIFLDNHDDFTSDNKHAPQDLDALLLQKLGGNIFTPKQLLNGAATLKQAVTTPEKGWPLLKDLQGKFIFVLTGANIDGYIESGKTANDRIGFIAEEISNDTAGEIGKRDHVIFYNFSWGNQGLGPAIFAQQFISRVFPQWILSLKPHFNMSSKQEWDEAKQMKIHHLATNEINWQESPWAHTHDESGWPFERIDEIGAS
ncbi:MAG: hypothetical protein HY033_05535 [Ignavibacteriae bacterium]|nr:hypothetical protein [Ignavibacteriota bacterium]